MAQLTPVDVVLDQLKAKARCLVGEEEIDLSSALGRVLAKDVASKINVPPADNSAMDGYAISVDDFVVGESLVISDRIPAGYVGQTLQAGSAARIFTGANIPPGCDAVVMQENTEVIDGKVFFHSGVKKGQNIRLCGQDIREGDVILKAGRKLKPQDLGLLASIGCGSISVYQKLKVAVLSTGDELVDPSKELKPGQIYNSNQYTLIALIEQLGMQAIDLGFVADSFEATEKALLFAADQADCIVSSGGVSVGEEDYVKAVVEKLGSLDIWKLAIKPGKPLAFGSVKETAFFGLPGNPVSSFVTFNIVARPYLMLSQGCHESQLQQIDAKADFDLQAGSRREYVRVQLGINQEGQCIAKNFSNQGSGIMTSVSWADGLGEIEIGRSIKRGDILPVHLLDTLAAAN